MKVYIQKNIDDQWRTILAVKSEVVMKTFDHFCKQFCRSIFRISTTPENRDVEGLTGTSLVEALTILADTNLTGLTPKQARELFKELTELMRQIRQRYQY